MRTISPEARQLAELQLRGAEQGGARVRHEAVVEQHIAEHQPSPEGAAAYRSWFTTFRMEVKPKDREILDACERLNVTMDGRPYAAWARGEGPIVLLIHGLHGNSGQMSRFIEPLVEAGFRVVAMDAPAHGDNDGNTTDLFQFHELYLRVIAEVGEPYAVIAASLGNTWALYSLSRGSSAQKVVCIAPPAQQSFLFESFRNIHGLSDAVVAEFVAMHHARFGSFERYDNTGFAQQITASALIFHDRDDPIVPFDVGGERLAAAWPGATFVATEGLGHFRIMRDPEVVRQVLAFLRG